MSFINLHFPFLLAKSAPSFCLFDEAYSNIAGTHFKFQSWSASLKTALLLRICDITNTPIITPHTLAYLRITIEEKLRLFKEIYTGNKFIPRCISQIERLGPLIHS